MSAYDDDPRVERVSDIEYRIYRIGERSCAWALKEEGGVWNGYDQHGRPSRIICDFSSADTAIKIVLGELR